MTVAACACAAPALALCAAAAPKDGEYKGSLGAGYPLTFEVSGGGTVLGGLTASFQETCNGAPGSATPVFHFPTLKIHAGAFSGRSTDRYGQTVSEALRISGKLSGGKATGTVTSTSKIKSLGSCNQSEPFTAAIR